VLIKKIIVVIALELSLFSAIQAGTAGEPTYNHPFYIGGFGGYGSTTWEGLVPTINNQNSAISISTPIEVKEGGGVWGVHTGYEFSPNFALEGSYTRYEDAEVNFDEMSIFTFDHDNLTQFVTRTETLSLMGKLMIFIPRTTLRAFSSLGVANVHRKDMLMNKWRVAPTFGGGFNYHFTEHFLGEINGNYTAGYGESQLNPTDTYFPFLYSVTLRLAYCF